MPLISRARIPSKKNQPDAGLPLFDWRPQAVEPAAPSPFDIVVHRLSERCRVPLAVAAAHARAAGLCREVSHV